MTESRNREAWVKRTHSVLKWVRKNMVLFFTVVAAVFGILIGFILRKHELSDDVVEYITFPGELLLRALYMVVPLLIITSIVTGS